jgi:hypothetical protein
MISLFGAFRFSHIITVQMNIPIAIQKAALDRSGISILYMTVVVAAASGLLGTLAICSPDDEEDGLPSDCFTHGGCSMYTT